MPIYEFKCQKCGKTFEELIRDSGDLKDLFCTYCQSKDIIKIISKFSIAKTESDLSNTSSGKCSGCTASSCSSCG